MYVPTLYRFLCQWTLGLLLASSVLCSVSACLSPVNKSAFRILLDNLRILCFISSVSSLLSYKVTDPGSRHWSVGVFLGL